MNVFRPVDGDTVLPERIFQGKPWRNISFAKNASKATYRKHGLYLEVANKPVISKYQFRTPVDEVIDHTQKIVTIQWEVHDHPPEKVAEIAEQDAREEERKNGILSHVTLEQGELWIETNVTDLASAKAALKKLLRLIIART